MTALMDQPIIACIPGIKKYIARPVSFELKYFSSYFVWFRGIFFSISIADKDINKYRCLYQYNDTTDNSPDNLGNIKKIPR